MSEKNNNSKRPEDPIHQIFGCLGDVLGVICATNTGLETGRMMSEEEVQAQKEDFRNFLKTMFGIKVDYAEPSKEPATKPAKENKPCCCECEGNDSCKNKKKRDGYGKEIVPESTTANTDTNAGADCRNLSSPTFVEYINSIEKKYIEEITELAQRIANIFVYNYTAGYFLTYVEGSKKYTQIHVSLARLLDIANEYDIIKKYAHKTNEDEDTEISPEEYECGYYDGYDFIDRNFFGLRSMIFNNVVHYLREKGIMTHVSDMEIFKEDKIVNLIIIPSFNEMDYGRD